MATPAGLSAPLVLPKVVAGGVTDFVGELPAVAMEVIEALTVLFRDRVCAVPLPETCDAVVFAESVATPELAVTLGAIVDVAVVFNEEVAGSFVGVEWPAVYADTLTSYWLTIGAMSWITRLASACRKLVAIGWSDEGMAVTHDGRGADVVVMKASR